MLKKHSQLFENILFISDLVIIATSWLLAYYLRFYGGLMPVHKGIPPFSMYLYLLVPITVIWGFAFKAFDLYRPRRIGSHVSEVFDIAKACVLSVLVLVAGTFFIRHFEFSRLVFIIFAFINVIALSVERWVFRDVLRYLRKKGYNLRYALVVGTDGPAKEVLKRLDTHPEVGIKAEGIISTDKLDVGKRISGVEVLGVLSDIGDIIRKKKIDQVIVAMTWDEHHRFRDVIKNIDDEAVDIKVVPDIYEFMTLRGGVEEFEGLPIISLQDSPLYGWNIVIKRAVDIAFSVVSIVITAPLMALIAFLIKLTSPGSVLYRQERVGIGGDVFHMLKFRSMDEEAERETGAVWASEKDPRRTRVGALLRRTSLDELPQLFNVLKGDMSLVGPRPERLVFIQEFRRHVPGYMLRHKMKAGITGWAQVNGWRGNTDLNKRIEHDLYYIENWSPVLDFKILWLTIWKGLINRNAY